MRDKYNITAHKPEFKMVSGINDTFSIVGNVELKLFNSQGEVIQEYVGHNQVVNIGRYTVARLVCSVNLPSPTESILNTLRIAGGAVASGGDHMDPDRPSAMDTDMFESNPTKIATYVIDPPTISMMDPVMPPLVTFTKMVTSEEINMLINEVGMYFGLTGPMFAHYSFPSMDLREETGNALEIRWKFTF